MVGFVNINNLQYSELVPLRGQPPKKCSNLVTFGKVDYQSKLPMLENPVPKESKLVSILLGYEFAKKLYTYSNRLGMNPQQYIQLYAKHLAPLPGVLAEEPVTANIGRTKVTTLIDGEQIFEKTLEYVKSAKKSIQVEMFEFQNLKIDGDDWPSKGAETNPGWEYQQKLLDAIIQKKRDNPELKVQMILDVHKWYMDGNGSKERDYSFVEKKLLDLGLVKSRDKYRKYANMKMIKYLKENGIDVVPYPRRNQGGTVLQHVKLLAVDSKKIIIGGMNWGNHSAANHDCCVAVESTEYKAGKPYSSTEVDNIIEEIFNKDWKFSWQRLGKTNFTTGPLTQEEQANYNGLKKKIKAEEIEYNQIVGEIFNKPEYKERYEKGNLDLIKVNPIEKPEIKILTNKPRELSYINETGAESIGEYIKEHLKTATSLRAELFVLSHKEITNMIIKRYKEAQAGGKPFDVHILISPEILEEFPYCQAAALSLMEAGVPLRTFKTLDVIEQRLHCKLAVFDEKDVIIGSANWSAVGLEQNLDKGKRKDYPLTNKKIDEIIISEHKEAVESVENEFGMKSIFESQNNIFDYGLLKNRKKELKKELERVEKEHDVTINLVDGKSIEATDENIIIIKRILKRYKSIQRIENSKERYHRGNNECAVVFTSPKIAKTFARQFEKDWKYSDIDEKYVPYMPESQVAFKGAKNSMRGFITSREPKFDKLV